MRKLLRFSVAVVAVVLLLAQFVRPAKTNPAADPAAHLTAHARVPVDVQKVLERSCYDCHSNQTTWPWYSNVAPASWLVADDVNHGRRHLNFSTWGSNDADQRSGLLKEICQEVSEGKMPLPIYTVVHKDAEVSSEEAHLVCDWARAEAARLPVTAEQGKRQRVRND
jgi:hypothetical protein